MSTTPGVQIRCKICGENEFERIGNREVCRYCKAAYVVYDPGLEAELRMAESFRESAQFDVAAALYNKLLRTYEGQELSDVYWGLFLCEQKVMFETDEHGERFPSFYAIVPAAPVSLPRCKTPSRRQSSTTQKRRTPSARLPKRSHAPRSFTAASTRPPSPMISSSASSAPPPTEP